MNPKHEADAGLLTQDVVYAGLDALRATVSLDLCAYLHAPTGEAPQLFLGTPDLASIDPANAFTLFNALRDALETDQEGETEVLLAGYHAILIPSAGGRSRGLHVAGRKDVPFDETEQHGTVRLARTLALVVHTLEASGTSLARPSADLVRVAVEIVNGVARAEVAAPFGDEIRTGVGEGSTPMRAVASAVLESVDASLKLLDATEGDVGGETAALVVVADGHGRLGIGSALIGARVDSLQAAAKAAVMASERLEDPHR